MSKILKRCFAYFIDLMVIMVIAQCISGIPLLNKQLEKYNKYYNEYTETLTEYYDFKSDFTNKYQDEELTEKEYKKLIEDNESYQEIIDKYYEDKVITQKEYNKINDQIDEEYLKEYKRLYYQIEKNSTVYFLVYLIVIFAYFVGFNRITNGQTLGKKLLRLKITSSEEGVEKVPIWSYIVRSIILYQPIYYLVKLIGIYTLSSVDYYNVTSVIYEIQHYLEFIVIISVMLRLDGRGIHDLLSKTRVMLLDREGNEIEEQSVTFITKKLDKQVEKQRKNKKQVKTFDEE